jgi:hypothetical protein
MNNLLDQVENAKYKILCALYKNNINSEQNRSFDVLIEDIIKEYDRLKKENFELKSNLATLTKIQAE